LLRQHGDEAAFRSALRRGERLSAYNITLDHEKGRAEREAARAMPTRALGAKSRQHFASRFQTARSGPNRNGAGHALVVRPILHDQRPVRVGEAIFRPDALDVDERGLAQAIDGVLERGDGDGIIEVRCRCHEVTTR
jgi:hypothetical protein